MFRVIASYQSNLERLVLKTHHFERNLNTVQVSNGQIFQYQSTKMVLLLDIFYINTTDVGTGSNVVGDKY